MIPSSSLIVTLEVSDLMFIGNQVDISLIVMENILLLSCSALSIIFTSNDDDIIPLLIVILNTTGSSDLS